GGRRAGAGPRERGAELGALPLELPEREVQPSAPFAERSLRLREQPRDAGDPRKLDAAPGAAQAVRRLVERRAVAARARERSGSRHGQPASTERALLCARNARCVSRRRLVPGTSFSENRCLAPISKTGA